MRPVTTGWPPRSSTSHVSLKNCSHPMTRGSSGGAGVASTASASDASSAIASVPNRPTGSGYRRHDALDEAGHVRLVDPPDDDDQIAVGIDPDDVAARAARGEARLRRARELTPSGVEPPKEPVLRVDRARPAHLGDPRAGHELATAPTARAVHEQTEARVIARGHPEPAAPVRAARHRRHPHAV